MKNYLFLFLLFIACDNAEESKEASETERTISFATSLKADANKLDQLYLYSKYDGKGYVKLVHFGHNEQHLGSFVDDPNSNEFRFQIDKSLSVTKIKSEKYKDYFLYISNFNKIKDLKIKVHYETLNFDTIINNDKNLIPLRRFKNPKESKIKVSFIHPKIKLEPLSFVYYYTGLTITDKTSLQSSIFFKKNSSTISMFEYLESNDKRKVRTYDIIK